MISITDTFLRQASGRVDVLGRYEVFARWINLLNDVDAVMTSQREVARRRAAHLAGRRTVAERREAKELDARRRLEPDRSPRGSRDPVVFWREGGHGPALLLLNGWTASGLVWPIRFVDGLERRFRVIRVDNRGSGWSRTAPAPFSIGDLANDAASVLRALDTTTATVVGLSMGGIIAQELALRHPDLVERLVLVGTRPPAPFNIQAAPEVLRTVLNGRKPGQPLDDYFRTAWGYQVSPGFADEHPDLFEELIAQVLERPTPRVGIVNQLRAIVGWSGPDRVRRIAAPTVVVHGTLDRLVPVGNGMRLARLIPEARYVELPEVGHLVPLEAADELLTVIEEAS